MSDQNSTIPKGWKVTTLGDVADIIMGQSPIGESYNQENDGLPFYQGITDFGDKYVDIKTFTNQPTKIIDANSILFSVRAPVGKVNFTKHRACIGRGNAGLKMKNGEQGFLYFLLKKSEKEFLSNTTGTVFDSISGGQLRDFEIVIPEDKEEQRAIAAVLSSLDDKIELLREQNKTLEATAQAIFKEWFVNFNFPGATGKMVDSELGEIPDGWRVGKLGDVIEIRGGTTPSTENLDFWNGNISWTSPKDLSGSNELFLIKTEKKITEQGLNKISSGLLPVGTLLLSSRAPIGYLAITNIEVAINQGYIAFLPDKYISNQFMYLWLKLNMDTVIASANGSTFLEISKSSFKNIDCVIPESLILEKFTESISSVFKKILNNTAQIQTLSILRDTLLPKLMNGNIQVKEV